MRPVQRDRNWVVERCNFHADSIRRASADIDHNQSDRPAGYNKHSFTLDESTLLAHFVLPRCLPSRTSCVAPMTSLPAKVAQIDWFPKVANRSRRTSIPTPQSAVSIKRPALVGLLPQQVPTTNRATDNRWPHAAFKIIASSHTFSRLLAGCGRKGAPIRRRRETFRGWRRLPVQRHRAQANFTAR